MANTLIEIMGDASTSQPKIDIMETIPMTMKMIVDTGVEISPIILGAPGASVSAPMYSIPKSRWNNECTMFALVPCMIVMTLLVLSVLKRLPKAEGRGFHTSLWIIFAVCAMFGLVFQPEAEDPSIVVCFGAGIQMFSLSLFWLLPRKASKPDAVNGNGDSPAFAMLMMVVLMLRLPCTLRFQGYLPTDQSGDGAYQLFEFVTLLLAIRGLARTGLTTKDGIYAAAALTMSILLALVCYGDLNRRQFADRAVAASMYIEVCAWGFLVYATITSGADRTIPSSFLPPALVQACCRTYFWYLASSEMAPQKSKLLMDYFPDAIVAVHFAMCGLIGLAALLVCCPEKDTLVSPTMHDSINSVVHDAAGAYEMAAGGVEELAKGLVPLRAVWENGVMKVEYAMPEDKGK